MEQAGDGAPSSAAPTVGGGISGFRPSPDEWSARTQERLHLVGAAEAAAGAAQQHEEQRHCRTVLLLLCFLLQCSFNFELFCGQTRLLQLHLVHRSYILSVFRFNSSLWTPVEQSIAKDLPKKKGEEKPI